MSVLGPRKLLRGERFANSVHVPQIKVAIIAHERGVRSIQTAPQPLPAIPDQPSRDGSRSLRRRRPLPSRSRNVVQVLENHRHASRMPRQYLGMVTLTTGQLRRAPRSVSQLSSGRRGPIPVGDLEQVLTHRRGQRDTSHLGTGNRRSSAGIADNSHAGDESAHRPS